MYWIAGVPGSDKNSIPVDGFPNDIVTIFDRLEEAGITWKFYIQNYDPSITYRTRTDIAGPRAAQVVWCPLLAIPRYLDDPALSRHIVPLDEYFTDLQNGTLPEVAYIVPSGASEHPPGSIQAGQRFVRSLIQALMRSPYWYHSAFLVTYDDWGGWYDHVPPPQVDEYGYGFRVPAFLVSPYAKRGFIDSTTYDFTSILKFIEENWDLEPLAARDAAATSIMNAFDFESPPRPPTFIPWDWPPTPPAPEPRRSAVYGLYSLAAGIGIIAFLVPTGRIRLLGNWLPKRFRRSHRGAKGLRR
jgi:phospholipase C